MPRHKGASFESKNPHVLVFVLFRRPGVIQGNDSSPIRKTRAVRVYGRWQRIFIVVSIVGKNYNEIDTRCRRGPTDSLKPFPIAFYSLILCYGNAIGGNVR